MAADEDAKSWGISDNNLKLLEKTINICEKDQETEKAQRILNRYTLYRFSAPQEWQEWLTANKKRLFFTESGGGLFMVNSRDKLVIIVVVIIFFSLPAKKSFSPDR